MSSDSAEQQNEEAAVIKGSLRTYREPWKGQLVLACGKCQKKLKRGGNKHALGKLKKLLKERAEEDRDMRLRVVTVSCLKLCPKGGVTACTPGQLARAECSILYTKEDAKSLYTLLKYERRAATLTP